MTRLVGHRFEVAFSLLELDDGEPVNEHGQQPVVLYGVAALRAWADALPGRITEAEQQLSGSTNGRVEGSPTL
jgi:hypothetical protein